MLSIAGFRKIIFAYYEKEGRVLPWRQTRDPYCILVSEIMLQQTQVARVEGYYATFLKQFPDFRSLARVATSDVLSAWQGLGYNRRALALQNLAKIVVKENGGKLPRDRSSLESLPGVGSYTAGALRAFAFGESEIFIETNIRRVFIHFFFPRKKNISDAQILPYLQKSLPIKNIREWYWALMDYGAMLGVVSKQNPNRQSIHYVKQSRFSGSDRELRGKILRLLLRKKKIAQMELMKTIPESRQRIDKVVTALESEKFIKRKKRVGQYYLTIVG